MQRHVRILFSATFLLIGGVFAAAVAAVAAYYDPANNIRYETPIGSEVLVAGFTSPTRAAIQRALTVQEWALAICYATGVSAFLLTSRRPKSVARCVVFGTHVLALPWGWLGLVMIPEALFGQLDGEWLGEHAPTMIAAGLWILCALTMVVVSWDGEWVRRRPATGPMTAPKLPPNDTTNIVKNAGP